MNPIFKSVLAALAPNLVHFLIPAAILIAMVILTMMLVNRPKDLKFAVDALTAIKALLGEKLGNKTNDVLSVWLDALKFVQKNDDPASLPQAFAEYVKDRCAERGINLTTIETKAIEEAAEATLHLFKTKKTAVTAAVTRMTFSAQSAVVASSMSH